MPDRAATSEVPAATTVSSPSCLGRSNSSNAGRAGPYSTSSGSVTTITKTGQSPASPAVATAPGTPRGRSNSTSVATAGRPARGGVARVPLFGVHGPIVIVVRATVRSLEPDLSANRKSARPRCVRQSERHRPRRTCATSGRGDARAHGPRYPQIAAIRALCNIRHAQMMRGCLSADVRKPQDSSRSVPQMAQKSRNSVNARRGVSANLLLTLGIVVVAVAVIGGVLLSTGPDGAADGCRRGPERAACRPGQQHAHRAARQQGDRRRVPRLPVPGLRRLLRQRHQEARDGLRRADHVRHPQLPADVHPLAAAGRPRRGGRRGTGQVRARCTTSSTTTTNSGRSRRTASRSAPTSSRRPHCSTPTPPRSAWTSTASTPTWRPPAVQQRIDADLAAGEKRRRHQHPHDLRQRQTVRTRRATRFADVDRQLRDHDRQGTGLMTDDGARTVLRSRSRSAVPRRRPGRSRRRGRAHPREDREAHRPRLRADLLASTRSSRAAR